MMDDDHLDMSGWDPWKVVRVLERLFGPKSGRFIATVLATLACVAAALWLVSVIWENGGRYLSLEISVLLNANLKDVVNAQATISTVLTIFIIFGIVFVVVLYFLSRSIFRKAVSQDALNTLSVLRADGINNLYANPPTDAVEFSSWKSNLKTWEDAVLDHIQKNFPQSDYLFIKNLGVVIPWQFPKLRFNDEHESLLTLLVRRFDLIESILNSYRR